MQASVVFLIVLLAVAVGCVTYVVLAQNLDNSVNEASNTDSTGSTGAIITYDGEPFHAPEYNLGGAVIALVVCIGTFAVYKRYRR